MEAAARRQQAAHANLHAAIAEIIDAYGWADSGLLTDWVVITAQQTYDNDGDPLPSYSLLMPDGAMPEHRVLGLFDIGRRIIYGGHGFARQMRWVDCDDD